MTAPRDEAFGWLTRQLGWERTLEELRARAEAGTDRTGATVTDARKAA